MTANYHKLGPWTPTLKQGDKGDATAELQRKLPPWCQGLTPLVPDGDFGPATTAAVKMFQETRMLTADGVVGDITRSLLSKRHTKIIDVSRHQGVVDWHEVSKNYRNAILKATEGVTYQDPVTTGPVGAHIAREHLDGLGYYHFARGGENTAAAEACNFLNTIKNMPRPRVIALDVEGQFETMGEDAYRWISDWFRTVRAEHWIAFSFLYTSPRILREKGIPSKVATLAKLWVPRYGPQPDPHPWDDWRIWQYTSTGGVPGITGPVDINWCESWIWE